MRRRSSRATWPRVTVATLLLIATSGLFAAVSLPLQSGYGHELRSLEAERMVLPYAEALATLTDDLVAARTATSNGDKHEMTDRLTALSDADAPVDAVMATGHRPAALRDAIERVRTAGPTGRTAFDQYTDLVEQAVELGGAIAAGPVVGADPQPQRRALVRLVVDTLPTIVSAAGRLADLAVLAPAPGANDLVDIALTRRDVGLADTTMVDAVLAAAAVSPRRSYADAVIEQVESLRTAATPLVTGRPATDLLGAALQVRGEAQRLRRTILAELDASLADGQAAVRNRQSVTFAAVAVGVVLMLATLWWSVTPPVGTADDGPDGSGSATAPLRQLQSPPAPASRGAPATDTSGQTGMWQPVDPITERDQLFDYVAGLARAEGRDGERRDEERCP